MGEIRIYTENDQRFIDIEGKKNRLRVVTEDVIKNMSNGSLISYRNKILSWRSLIHASGYIKAIKAIDYLANATSREYSKRNAQAWLETGDKLRK